MLYSRVGEAAVASVGAVVVTDDGDLLAAGLLVTARAVLAGGLVALLLLSVSLLSSKVLATKVTGRGGRSSESSSTAGAMELGVGGLELRSETAASATVGGRLEEVGASSRASVAGRGDVGVAQMRSQDAVYRQGDAHKLRGSQEEGGVDLVKFNSQRSHLIQLNGGALGFILTSFMLIVDS